MAIVVRSFGRADLIKQMTLKVLAEQKDLSLDKDLYLVVHTDEVKEYERTLKDFPIADLIVKTKKGGHESIKAAHKHFPEGEPLVFLDDDNIGFQHYQKLDAKAETRMLNLGEYIEDAFLTLSNYSWGSWTANLITNFHWMKGKPWKEFRPYHMAGGFWGAYNSSLIPTNTAHEDDRVRTARYIEKYGGCLVYNWIGSKGFERTVSGGMQSSGDRANEKARYMKTWGICKHLHRTDRLYHKYHTEPYYKKSTGYWTVRLKSITQMRKLRHFKHYKWSNYFQGPQNPDKRWVIGSRKGPKF
tara:strand:+ start:790 stop:1689 length:900 start_codon:yes stop_codon:yes gene_type:complete